MQQGREVTAALVTRVARVIRLVWPDRNPLRRTVDRAETVIMAALTIVFLLAAPLAVTVTWHVVYAVGVRTARAERRSWHQARAIVLARPVAAGFSGQPEAAARWTAPGGARLGGIVPAPRGARPGSTVPVWTDAAGRQTGPPLTSAQVRGQAAVAATIAPALLGLILLGAGIAARGVLGRRRLAAWDEEWRTTGPRWTIQR
jgi:hypothetical protein